MYKIKFLTYVFAVMFLWGQCMNVCAKEPTPISIDGEIHTWTETTDLQVEKSDDKEIHIVGTALQKDATYNYATISSVFGGTNQKGVYQKEYAGITLEIENVKDRPIYLSLFLMDRNNSQMVLQDNAYIIKEIDGKKILETGKNATFEIPEGFQGKVTIPLSMMKESENNEKKFNYSQLALWSVGMFSEGNESIDLHIRSLVWQKQDYLQQYENSFGAHMEGAEMVQIPEHGESISFYEIVSEFEHSYQFVVDGLPQGVSIDKTGKLVLDTSVEEQVITLEAMDDLGMIIYKEVELKDSWRKSSKGAYFYGPDQLEKIEYPFDFVKESHIIALRLGLLAGCVIVFISYLVCYARYQQEKKKEDK